MLVGILEYFQVVTQIQEMSLSFIPKIITVVLVLQIFGPWMLRFWSTILPKLSLVFQLIFCRYMASTAFFSWALGALLASIRVGMMFAAAPLFGNVPVPKSIKVILIVGLGAGFSTKLNIGSIDTMQLSWLVSAMISEMLIGAAMAFALDVSRFYSSRKTLTFPQKVFSRTLHYLVGLTSPPRAVT